MTKKNAKRRRHSAEFNAEAVRLVESRGDRTVAEIAQSLGALESLLPSRISRRSPGTYHSERAPCTRSGGAEVFDRAMT